MSDPIFFLRDRQLSLADLVALTGARARPEADLSACVYGCALVEEAEPGDLAFFVDSQPPKALAATGATACFVPERFAALAPTGTVALATADPEQAFAVALSRMYLSALRPGSLFAATGANPGATVHPEARLEPGVVVDPGVVVGPRAEVGAGSIIAANSVVGPGVRIGRDCSIGAHTTLVNALLGDRIVVHPGARIGQSGRVGGPTAAPPAPSIGRVIIQDDVEIGANATIDRGARRDTVIGEGAVIGNLVQIGSDAMVGRRCRIVSQAMIRACARLADFACIEAADAPIG